MPHNKLQRMIFNDLTPSPKPGETQQVSRNFANPSMSVLRSNPVGPDGIAYYVEAIVGHADLNDLDGLFVLV